MKMCISSICDHHILIKNVVKNFDHIFHQYFQSKIIDEKFKRVIFYKAIQETHFISLMRKYILGFD